MLTEVRSSKSGEVVAYYATTPREAVIAAFAQFAKEDSNTWEYQEKYSHLVEECRHGFVVGPFWAQKERG